MPFHMDALHLILNRRLHVLTPEYSEKLTAQLLEELGNGQPWESEHMTESAACEVLMTAGYIVVAPWAQEEFKQEASRIGTPQHALVELEKEVAAFKKGVGEGQENLLERSRILERQAKQWEKKCAYLKQERDKFAKARQADAAKIARSVRAVNIAERKLAELQAVKSPESDDQPAEAQSVAEHLLTQQGGPETRQLRGGLDA